ncbi:quinoprotein dehydrogenase-associated SoxYZ-like carrier [Arcobacter sp. F2176]|uniref:quinoprotein dehydrogenase-associated SoxYZ-like carrier n=1 Tax=Arcobacter sp. F2176 TaxID=2044511 RepID=UPI00100B8C41|nr:quinoprotein dehydrogenase-associated SoxYZ-like carrier [Arcobacter sp. F2176]RXJ82314.1 quinoprotein dehydrogenase-associated SoxYZ-like carrier [Arcobacter sp. F2176]
MKKFVFTIIFLIVNINLSADEIIDSSSFLDITKPIMGENKYVFDNKNIKIQVPKFADNSLQVPIYIDASKIMNAKRMLIFADYNPIPIIIDMDIKEILPVFSTNIKVANETPLRILVLDNKNIWHVNNALIKSLGGGCDVSSLASKDKSFAKKLGITKGKIFIKNNNKRIKASIFHPMETGLIFGSLEFYIEKITIQDSNKILSTIKTTSAISENPRFIFEINKKVKNLNIHFFDNEGNDFKLEL